MAAETARVEQGPFLARGWRTFFGVFVIIVVDVVDVVVVVLGAPGF